MKTIYVADDGTTFDDYFECENYEEGIKHPDLYDIAFLDLIGEKLNPDEFPKGVFDDLLYQKCEWVIVHNEEEVSDLQWLADYCGWNEFEQITSPGTWERKDCAWGGVWKKE